MRAEFLMFAGNLKPWAVAGVFVALALAGCVGDAEQNDDSVAKAKGKGGSQDVDLSWTKYKTAQAPDYPFDRAFEVVHAHDVRELHTASAGFELVSHSYLNEGLAPYAFEGGFIEVDVHGDIAVVATLTGMRAFTLVDISDLSNPTVLSHFYSGNDNWDVRISEDGNLVFVGCQGTGLFTYTPVGQCTDYMGVPSPAGDQDNGIITVDIADRKNPKAVCWTPSLAVHNLETMTLNDGTILVANNAVELFKLKEDGCLEKQSQVPGRHDVALQYHPVTGVPLLYTGTNTMSIYDITNPKEPVDIGTMDANGVFGATAWHEQSPAPNTYFNGTHITLGAGERATGAPGPVTIIDTTNPDLPMAQGTWLLPVPAPDEDQATYNQGGYMFSEHNVEVNQWGQACIGHYHAGVWVIDFSTPERMKIPETLGFYLPHENPRPGAVSPTHPAATGTFSASPYVWGCAWTDDGTHVIIPDAQTGIYILKGLWFEEIDAEDGADA